MEYSLGFALQIIKLISSLDRSGHGRSCKLLEDAVKKFPSFNPFNPVRHVHFENVWEVVPSPNTNGKGKPSNTSNVVVMKEFYKIPSITFQVLLCCSSDPQIIPNNYTWCQEQGFEDPVFNPLQVIVNSLYSIMIVYWYLHAPRLSETQVVTLQQLVANAQGHLLVLDIVRKRMIELSKPKSALKTVVCNSSNKSESSYPIEKGISCKSSIIGVKGNTSTKQKSTNTFECNNYFGRSSSSRSSSSSSSNTCSNRRSSSSTSGSSSCSSSICSSTGASSRICEFKEEEYFSDNSAFNNNSDFVKKKRDLSLEDVCLLTNPKFEMLTHLVYCIRDSGCDNSVRDTQLGELFMKLVRGIWNTTSKKYVSEHYEMLKKYRNLLFLDFMKKGIVHRLGDNIFSQKRLYQGKAYMKDIHVHYSDQLSFAVNCISDTQSITWNVLNSTFESMDGKSLNVHNCLLDVSFL